MSDATRFRELCGSRVLGLLVVSVPLGAAQGLVEILFGFILLYFLSSFGLVQQVGLPPWISNLGPVSALIAVGAMRAALTLLATLASNLGYESFNVALRERVAEALRADTRALKLSVAGASNVLANLVPRAAAFVSAVTQMFLITLTLLVTVVGLVKISPELSFVAGLAFGVFSLPSVLTRRLFQGYSARVYAGSTEFSKSLLLSIRNLDFLRIIGRADAVRERLRLLNRSIFKDYVRYISWATINSTWPQLGGVCIVVSVVLANQSRSWLEAAVLIPFIYLLNRAAASLSALISALGNAQFNRPFFDSLSEQLRFESSCLADGELGNNGADLGRIQTLEVCRVEIGRTETLVSNLSFTARSGDMVVLLGESGKGKTTLLMSLIGLVPTRSGEVLWNGRGIASLGPDALLPRIAFSGPDPFLLDLSIRENLLLGNENLGRSDEDIREALRLASCDFVDSLADGLDHKLHEGGEGISAGQRQRLSIARAVLRNPEILILDEATANMDIALEAVIIKNLRARFPKTIVLAVSHRESLASFASIRVSLT